MTNLLKQIFSITNSDNKKHKVITILGIKLKFKKIKKELLYNPCSLIIDTTLYCNNNCSFCWRSNKPDYLKNVNQQYKTKTMPFKIYKKIIDDACQYNSLKWMSLSGPMGEPLMNDDIEQFFSYAYKKNHFDQIVINTNGLAINKRDISILLNSIHEFSISVDSIKSDTYEKIHGHKNLSQVIENIKSCVEYKRKNGCVAKIVVRFTENALNIGQIDEFLDFFKEIGVDEVNYTKEHAFAGVNDKLKNKTEMYNCGQPTKVVNFNFLGEMSTCCVNWQINPTFGNIKNKTIKQLWESKNKVNWNEKTRFNEEPCKNCSGLGDVQCSIRINMNDYKKGTKING